MKKIFDTFITQVHQNISMIWILWYPELDLSNKQSFQASLHYIATKYYEQWNIKPEFVISTIDQINKIDSWAFGCIIYYLITNQMLYDANTIEELNYKIENEDMDRKILNIFNRLYGIY